MKLGDLISTGARFKEIADFSTEKMAGELYGGFCAIFMKEKTGDYSLTSSFDNSGKNVAEGNIIKKLPLLEKQFSKNAYLLIDSRPPTEQWQKELREEFSRMNAIFFPMKANNQTIGIIMSGNFAEEVKFSDEDAEVVRAFERELILGYQSSMAANMVKSLEIVDNLTGLYTFSYLEERLEDEINRSVYYQRPCSLIVVDVDDFKEYTEHYGASKAEQALKQVGNLLRGAMSPIGKAARSEHDEFGILLPEKNKREALDLAEDIRKKIEKIEGLVGEDDSITVSIGVGENPIDGVNAKEVIACARQYVAKAKEQGKNRVVGE
jgi:diguanylate cyclase (GGDEF)-like protein